MSSRASVALLLGALSAVHAAAPLPEAFASSLDTVYQLSPFTAPQLNGQNTGGISSTWSGTVDDTASGYKQNITGFGAAITDATVASFQSLPKNQYQKLMNELFNPNSGIGMSLMRHTIGSSDLSAVGYSYDDSKGPDLKLNNFNLQSYGRSMTSFIDDVATYNPSLILLGSVWSPPAWMKLNDALYDGSTTNNSLNMEYASQYAQYFVEYVQKYQQKGIQVDAITIQNEPLNSNGGFPTMLLEPNDAANLIQNYIGPAFKKNNISTEIWAYDHNTDRPDYPQTVLDVAGDYVNTVAWHCYANPLDWSVLGNFRANNSAKFPDLKQYMTECWLSPLTSWYQSIEFILEPLQNWANGAIGWTLGTYTTLGPHIAGGCNSCRGIIEVDKSTGTYTKTLDYYFFGQFSKFMKRGAQVLSTTGSYDFGSGSACLYTATLNADGTRTVVIFNGFGNELFMTLTFGSGEVWTGPLYQYSLTTWVLPPVAS